MGNVSHVLAGDTAVPAACMEQIPLQLAARLRAGTLVTGARVGKVTRNAQSFQIEINGRENLEARAVVLAVAGNEGNALLGGVSGWSVPEVRGLEPNHRLLLCGRADTRRRAHHYVERRRTGAPDQSTTSR